jgi:acyl-[acyl-carrier-protein]-phospholipid O-acyltransferase / long-chain-fatty-acid--[acyl-carrier-protein] ligase
MAAYGLYLLRTKRFGPLFITQVLNSFNDNFYRTALLFVIAFRIVPGDAAAAGTWAVVAGGIFVLPYFMFSSLAGELAERMDKARLARILRAIDVGVMCVAAVALFMSSLALMLIALFGTGVRGVLFGPLKYAILPQHLSPGELLAATGLMKAAIFFATIAGQIAAALLPYAFTAVALVAISLIAFGAACAIPAAPASQPGLPIGRNLASGMLNLVKSAMLERSLLGAILGISWFYAMGALLTSQLPSLVANVVGAVEDVGAVLLASFTTGVAAGTIAVVSLLKGQISTRFVPISALVLALFTVDLSFVASGFSPGPDRIGIAEFLAQPAAWRLLFDLFGIAAAGGVFAVPLYAVLQTAGDPKRRARTVAANNLANAAAVVVAALLAGLLFALGGTIPTLILMLGIATLGVAAVAWRNAQRLRSCNTG